MKFRSIIFLVLTVCSVCPNYAQSLGSAFNRFDLIYQSELGSTKGCEQPEQDVFRVCSDVLRNDGNAPYLLHHNKPTAKVMVLFHGLSDSPFYMGSIAKALHQQGHNVVVALMPGHGKKRADQDMRDAELSNRWRKHLAEIIHFSDQLGEQKYLAGFSTGGALATEYTLQNPKDAKGLMLFSGALALDSGAEKMLNIWGIQWLAKILDGDYQSEGDNPYKYPHVAKHAAVELVEVIMSVRELIEQGNKPNLPIFAAHSAADSTTPISGVKNLLKVNQGPTTLFEIPEELNLCHADLVISQQQLREMGDKSSSAKEEIKPCDNPSANPKHAEMLEALLSFVEAY